MGPVPAEILEGRLRAPHAPSPRSRGFSMPMGLRRRAVAPPPSAGPIEAGVALPIDGAEPALTDGAQHAPAP